VSFQSPLLLIGLVLVPLAVVLYARRERGAASDRDAFAPRHLFASVAPRRAGWRRHAPAALYALALAGLVLAVARPQATVAEPVEQASVMVVTDRSGSMLAEDVAPSRLVAARRAADSFLDAVPDDLRVGAIAFNTAPSILSQPTHDHAAVRRALAGVEAAGGTATGDALDSALKLIRSSQRGERQAPAAIVLLSDGKSVRGRDPVAVAEEARKARIPVYTVALGTAQGTIETRSGTEPVPPDPETLARIAEISGGESFAVADASRLERIYENLGSQVATEEREREVTGMFAGGALALIALGAIASLRWFGRFV
jgi:Ca-activated chloride channel family protein